MERVPYFLVSHGQNHGKTAVKEFNVRVKTKKKKKLYFERFRKKKFLEKKAKTNERLEIYKRRNNKLPFLE